MAHVQRAIRVVQMMDFRLQAGENHNCNRYISFCGLCMPRCASRGAARWLLMVCAAVLTFLVTLRWFVGGRHEHFEALTIMQTHRYEESEVPQAYANAVQSWKDQRNCSRVYFCNATTGRQFLSQNLDPKYLDAFDRIVPGAFKADLFRYCWLYVNGGVYADMDSVALIQVHDWLAEYDDVDVVLSRDDPTDKSALYQAFIYCKKPGNLLMKTCMDMVVQNTADLEAGKEFYWSDFTGPKMVYHAFCRLHPEYAGKVVPAALDPDTEGVLDTSFGRMMVLSWSGMMLVDNKGRGVFQHKCETCQDTDDGYYANYRTADYVRS